MAKLVLKQSIKAHGPLVVQSKPMKQAHELQESKLHVESICTKNKYEYTHVAIRLAIGGLKTAIK